MSDLRRRDMLKLMGAGAAAAAAACTPGEKTKTGDAGTPADSAAGGTRETSKGDFLTPRERETAGVLADLIIPKDERSGSATDAKAPEFVDFMLAEKDTSESSRVSMRGGLAWLDNETHRRFAKDFVRASDAQRRAVLDDIAYPRTAKPEFAAGTAWFSRFRSNIGSAFFSSAMGWQDLRYMGNVFNPNWNGCPPEATRKLGVSYEEYDASLARSRKA